MFVGERDFYQLVTLRHLVKDLSLPTAVTGVNTLRDSNGMAISRENKDPRMARPGPLCRTSGWRSCGAGGDSRRAGSG